MLRNLSKSLLVMSCLAASVSRGQDIHFSQYAETPVNVNPALIGVMYDTRAIANFRSQWGSVGKSYDTYGLTFEQAIGNKKVTKRSYWAVGVNLFRDQAGDAKMSNLSPNLGLSYITYLSDRQFKISGGIQGGLNYRTVNVDNLTWDSQFNGYKYDANRPSGEKTPRSAITAMDLGGGINLNYAESKRFLNSKDGHKFDIGVAAYHFQLPRNSFFNSTERLYGRYVGYMNGEIAIKALRLFLVPSIIHMRQGPSKETTVGFLFKYSLVDPTTFTNERKATTLSVGSYYRFKDAIVPTVAASYDKWSLGIAYDLNVSQLTPASNLRGGLEIMLRYNVTPGYGRAVDRTDTKASY